MLDDNLTIVNIVASGKFDREFDLEELAKTLDRKSGVEADYDIDSNSLYIDFEEHEPLAILYMSGSYSIRGGSSLSGVEAIQQDLESALEEAGISANHLETFEIKNIVCIGDLGRELVLSDIQESNLLGRVEFEPEQFPGLICRDPSTGGTAIIFSNGKVNLTGLGSVESINRLYRDTRSNLSD